MQAISERQKDHHSNVLNRYHGTRLFFRRARIICGGVVVEDIGYFHRLSLMLTALKTEEEQNCFAGEGFCNFDYKHAPPNTESDSRSTYRLRRRLRSIWSCFNVSQVSFQTYVWTFQPR